MSNTMDPPCTEIECFAYKNGCCAILTDNNFGERKCPFYQTKEQRERDQRRIEERLKSLERGDFYEDR